MSETSQDPSKSANNQVPHHNSQQTPINRSSKPVIAGSLLIIIGIIGIIFSSLMIGGGFIFDNLDNIVFEGYTVTSIQGNVIDSNGNPLSNVSITIDESHLFGTTGINGSYHIYGIPAGYHKIMIEKPGYNTLIYYTYIIPEGQNNDFTMPSSNKDSAIIFDNDKFDFQMSTGSETYIYGSEIPPHEQFLKQFGGWISGAGVVTMICSFLALVGGILSIQRKRYILVLICSIAAIFSIGFGIGALLAIIALIIVILSSNEFKESQKPYSS